MCHTVYYILLSIHAPTRGATIFICVSVLHKYLSIHAPTRGATANIHDYYVLHIFQSTLLQEERQSHSSIPIPFILLSIHAPTRGATVFYITICISFLFQSTLLQEERRIIQKMRLTTLLFQSTLLQEERRCTFLPFSLPNAFNPRSYKRSDCCIV